MNCFELESKREQLMCMLKERQQMLMKFNQELGEMRIRHPRGIIRVSRCNGAFQYYWKQKGSDKWNYLRKSRRAVAEKIIATEYYGSLQKKTLKELKKIGDWLSADSFVSVNEEYEKLPDGRKALLHPLVPSQEEVVTEFLDTSYERWDSFEENLQYETSKGEFVRSKAEWMIAEQLYKNDIPYQYEFPLYLDGLGTIHPDFRCLNVRTRKVVYWEHQGMMGDANYASHALRKLNAYEENGFYIGDNLIITEEAAEYPLFPKTIDRWIHRMLL